jgi:predicted RNase H-like HicB family nuclease
MNLTIATLREDDMTVAYCLENHVASQGSTKTEALANLREALSLYFADEQPLPHYPKIQVQAMKVAV